MFPMAKFSAIMWLNTLMAAQQGYEDEQENLQAENKMRAEMGYPVSGGRDAGHSGK